MRPLDELEKLILRHLASGPSSASDLTDALRASSQTHGLAITRAKIIYRLGGLVSLRLVGSAERKLPSQRRDFLYSLRAEPRATTEAAPAAEVVVEPVAVPVVEATPVASEPTPEPLTKAQLAARLALIKSRHQALIAQGKIKGGRR